MISAYEKVREPGTTYRRSVSVRRLALLIGNRDAAPVEPQLTKIEALTEAGCYTVTVTLNTGEERCVVARLRDGTPVLPAASVDGWSIESASYLATLAAVQAMHAARELAAPQGRRLSDVVGGWDVSLGNIVLDPAGQPSCVTHGELATEPGEIYRCTECGAVAAYR